ncbi:hypothetical protein VTK26DRAFT_3626 [Humicola hyalothermophila]
MRGPARCARCKGDGHGKNRPGQAKEQMTRRACGRSIIRLTRELMKPCVPALDRWTVTGSDFQTPALKRGQLSEPNTRVSGHIDKSVAVFGPALSDRCGEGNLLLQSPQPDLEAGFCRRSTEKGESRICGFKGILRTAKGSGAVWAAVLGGGWRSQERPRSCQTASQHLLMDVSVNGHRKIEMLS